MSEHTVRLGAAATAIAVAAVLGCPGGVSVIAAPTTGSPAPSTATSIAAAASPQPQRMRRVSFLDERGIGGEAFSLLVPEGWVSEGGITWHLDKPASPASLAVVVRDPQGLERFEIFPSLSFYWTDDRLLLANLPRGGRYLGSELQAPLGATASLERLVLPRYRPGAGALEVLERRPVPELAELAPQFPSGLAPGVTVATDAGAVRVRYHLGGRPVEEEIYGVAQVVTVALATLYGPTSSQTWSLDYLFSISAAAGDLDDAAPLLQAIAFSFRIDPDWFHRYSQLVQVLIQQQIQSIRAVADISHQISRTAAEISEQQQRQWQHDQEVRDRLSRSFSQYLRGVDEYLDPYSGDTVELPAGHDSAWANPLGEYLVSDDPFFDPNLSSTGSWQRMEPVP